MSAVKHSIRRARRELALVLVLPLLAYAVSAAFELSERLSRWFALAERWQADELPLALLVLACALAWYAFRRRAEAERALALHALAEGRASSLLARNRELSQGLIVLQENERRALARELHDEVGQCCTALRLETAFLRRADPADPAGMLAAAERADAAAQSIAQLVRGLLHRLRPAQLDMLGLVPALQELCESWEQRSGVACVFHHDGCDAGCDEAAAVAVYRVAQEALTNVMRHAKARRVRVLFTRSVAGELRLTVHDDGIGIDSGARPRQGLGLLGASERAAALGGTFAVSSRPGAGTRVELRLPWPAPAAKPARREEARA